MVKMFLQQHPYLPPRAGVDCLPGPDKGPDAATIESMQRMLDTDQVTAAGTISPLYRGQIDRVCDICTRAPARGSWSCICDDHAFTIQNARGRLSHSLCLCPKFPQRSRGVHHQRQTRAGETAASFLPGNNRPLCLAAGGGGSRGATLQLQARLPRVTIQYSTVQYSTVQYCHTGPRYSYKLDCHVS